MSGARRFVIIGAGPAGARAAEVLRGQAGDADILLIGDEPYLPYQRPPLSKEFLTKGQAAPPLDLKPESFFAEQRIRLKLGVAAVSIERAAKIVALADGERVAYDKLLLATGCGCRKLPASLGDAPIHYLRGLGDAARIREILVPGAEIVMIGGGFIGLELAASARTLGARVTVLEAAPRLLARSMPPAISDFVHNLHEKHGVRFEFSAAIQHIAKDRVETARASYPCDAVIGGIGAAPLTELAEAAGLVVEDGIRVDAQGRSSDPDIFAAGDVTRHDNPLLGRAIRVESWQVAINQAAVVARAMLGESEPYAEMPWLWTDQYDCNIQMLGFFDPGLDLIARGDTTGNSFTLLGLGEDGRMASAITVNNGRDMAVLRRLVAARAILPKEVLADTGRKLADLLKAVRG